MSITQLMAEIEHVTPEGGAWCSASKAHTLAALILSIRPKIVVEVGVWMGGSAIPIALALKAIGAGQLYAIDPWSITASVDGQNAVNAKWWGKVNHDEAHQVFVKRVHRHGLESFVKTLRMRSDDVDVAAMLGEYGAIDCMHLDGNHGEQAERDAERYLPSVRDGGFAILDDVAWEGGSVTKAVRYAQAIGFNPLYELDSGIVMQRQGHGAR